MNFPIKPLVEEIEELGHLGFDFVEISMDPPEAVPEKVRKLRTEIAKLGQQYGMGMIAHMPTFVSIADLSRGIRRASVVETMAALETASTLRMEKVVLHPARVTGLGKLAQSKVRQYGRSSLREILEKAETLNIPVCLENMFSQAGSFTTPREFKTIFREFPNLSMTLDIGHAFLVGGLNNILEFIRIFGNRIGHIHANDNFGKEDNHLPVGAGFIDFRQVLKELKSTGYDGTMTVEVFSRDRDYLSMSRDKLRQLWEKVA
jgi:sugar phosphate isomerase/epimerase